MKKIKLECDKVKLKEDYDEIILCKFNQLKYLDTLANHLNIGGKIIIEDIRDFTKVMKECAPNKSIPDSLHILSTLLRSNVRLEKLDEKVVIAIYPDEYM